MGFGLRLPWEAAAFLLGTGAATPNVFALDGHSAYQLRSYLPRAWFHRINSIDYGADGRSRCAVPTSAWPICCRSSPHGSSFPSRCCSRYLQSNFGTTNALDLRLIAAFDKPGARTRLAIYEATGHITQEPSHD